MLIYFAGLYSLENEGRYWECNIAKGNDWQCYNSDDLQLDYSLVEALAKLFMYITAIIDCRLFDSAILFCFLYSIVFFPVFPCIYFSLLLLNLLLGWLPTHILMLLYFSSLQSVPNEMFFRSTKISFSPGEYIMRPLGRVSLVQWQTQDESSSTLH